jgi:hypothetical protein
MGINNKWILVVIAILFTGCTPKALNPGAGNAYYCSDLH